MNGLFSKDQVRRAMNRFFLGSDDNRRDILVWRETVFLQYHLQHQIIEAAPKGNADDFSVEILDGLDLGLGYQFERRFGRRKKHEPNGQTAHSGGNRRPGGRRIFHGTAIANPFEDSLPLSDFG